MRYSIYLLLLWAGLLPAQVLTNLEVMNRLLDSVYTEAGQSGIVKPNSNVQLNLSGDLRYFESRLAARRPMELEPGEKVIFTPDAVSVLYQNPERDGWFGSIVYTRKITVSGNWFTDALGKRDFIREYSDTVPEDSIPSIEQTYLPMSVGQREPLSFFTGYFEEITAAVVTAVAAYLFYSVRSK